MCHRRTNVDRNNDDSFIIGIVESINNAYSRKKNSYYYYYHHCHYHFEDKYYFVNYFTNFLLRMMMTPTRLDSRFMWPVLFLFYYHYHYHCPYCSWQQLLLRDLSYQLSVEDNDDSVPMMTEVMVVVSGVFFSNKLDRSYL